jgi:hypothetical protein
MVEFVLGSSEKFPLQEMVDVRVQGEEEVIWVEKEDARAPD